MLFISPGGETGRRKGLKIPRTICPCRFDSGLGDQYGPGTRWRGTRLQLEVSGSIPHRVSIFVDFLLKK